MKIARHLQPLEATLFALVWATIAFAQDSAPEFVRIALDDDKRPRALQMSIASYVPADNDRLLQVDLISAIHIGDPSYYAELNARFRDYDALLYELVAPTDAVPGNRTNKHKGLLSTTQVGMTKLLEPLKTMPRSKLNSLFWSSTINSCPSANVQTTLNLVAQLN